MENLRARIFVSGIVQGVFFRGRRLVTLPGGRRIKLTHDSSGDNMFNM
jgi:hypothetical protein